MNELVDAHGMKIVSTPEIASLSGHLHSYSKSDATRSPRTIHPGVDLLGHVDRELGHLHHVTLRDDSRTPGYLFCVPRARTSAWSCPRLRMRTTTRTKASPQVL